jgi:hypothetical protein
MGDRDEWQPPADLLAFLDMVGLEALLTTACTRLGAWRLSGRVCRANVVFVLGLVSVRLRAERVMWALGGREV